jgi:putative molybdopterin biosynthesis protein
LCRSSYSDFEAEVVELTEKLMTVREVARYLSLNEKKIYALIKRGDIPCTKVTGKWLFPKRHVDRWLEETMQGTGRFESINVTGSHDPALDLLSSEVHERFRRLTVLSAHVGSLEGLVTVSRGGAHVSGVHLFDPDTGEYNVTFIRKYMSAAKPIIVHFLRREQGLIVRKGNPLGIGGFVDLSRRDVRFINRQRGSGTRLLLDYHLGRLGIDPEHIAGYEDCMSTHTDVASAIRSGRADVGLGVHAAASDLDFVPVTMEQYDFVVRKEYFYTEPLQKYMDVMRSRRFRERVAEMGGYDATDTGAVLSWG